MSRVGTLSAICAAIYSGSAAAALPGDLADLSALRTLPSNSAPAELAAFAGPTLLSNTYKEQLIEGAPAPLDISFEGAEVVNSDQTGWARTIGVEARLQQYSNGDGRTFQSEHRIIRGTLDTPNYGVFSVEALLPGRRFSQFYEVPQQNSENSPGTFSLVQRQMPFPNGVLGDHYLGLHSTASLPLISNQYRIALASRQIDGASGRWTQSADGLIVAASIGRLSGANFYNMSGINPDRGRVVVFGFQKRLSSNDGSGFTYAFQASRTQGQQGFSNPSAVFGIGGPTATSLNANSFINPFFATQPSENGSGFAQSLSYKLDNFFIQGNALTTVADAEFPKKVKTGFWVDTGWRQDGSPIEHKVGFNKLPAGQSWLGAATSSGSTGGYYRWRLQAPQLSVDAQIDHQRYSDSGLRFTQIYGSARQVDAFGIAWGSQFNVMKATNSTGRVLLFREAPWQSVDGTWRAFAGFNKASISHHIAGLEVSGKSDFLNWSTSATLNFPLSSPLMNSRSVGTDLIASVSRDAGPLGMNASYRHSTPMGGGSAGKSLNLSLNWRLARGLTLTGALSRNIGQVPALLSTLGAPQPLGLIAVIPIQNFASLTLRYDFSAGQTQPFLGATARQPNEGGNVGGGSIDGVVFLDANKNGLIDGAEIRVPGVTIVMDGKFAIRTDANGRYEFPYVSSGIHTLELIKDNLPLPWTLESETRKIEVELRGKNQVNFPAVRN